MGDLRWGDGGTPDDNGKHSHDPLPDFPAEWGPVIIPDDASELDAERHALLRERRRMTRRNRLRAMLGRPPLAAGPGEPHQPIGIPLLVMGVAVLITLVSLFAVTWIRGSANTFGLPSTSRRPDSTSAAELADINLSDTVGAPVRLGSVLPAVILLVDGCSCTSLINQLAHAAPPNVTVVPVGHSVPSDTAVAPNVRPLADPTGALTGRFPHDARSGNATAILLDKSAAVKATMNTVSSADEITAAQLAELAASH
jgi:hypothetical protein